MQGHRKRASAEPPARVPTRSVAAPAPRAPRAVLAAGTEAHYRDAAYYSATYADRSDDIDYYVALATERAAKGRCEVLEYGCGNGRILMPLARTGRTITGVDRSAPMLTDLRRALRAEPKAIQRRVTVRRGDMRNLRLDQRFDLVLCTFNTFLHLYGRRDVEAAASKVLDAQLERNFAHRLYIGV